MNHSSKPAQNSLDHGALFPYDAGADFWEDRTPTPAPTLDWAHAAARGILADLGDRRGVKQELDAVDHDVRAELVQSMAAIIRLANENKADYTVVVPPVVAHHPV